MDNFLKSQTFKTGMFVLLVLFVLTMVFKMGVRVGVKRAPHHQFSIIYGQRFGGHFRGHSGVMFKKAMFDKTMFEKKLLLKKQLIKDKIAADPATDGGLSGNEN